MARLRKVSGSSFVSFFYLIVGIALLATLVQSSSPPLHVGLLGALSLIASYGLNRMRRWGLFLTVLIAFPGMSLGCATIYAIYSLFGLGLTEILIISAMILYVAVLAFTTLYVIRKRNEFS